MKTLAVIGALSLLALSACDKHASDKSQPKATSAKVVPAASDTAEAVPANAAATAAYGEDEPMGCAGKGEAHADSCSGGCDQWDSAAAEVAKRKIPADAEWNTIPVSGMTCGGCERRVIANLGKLDGVLAVEADAELGQVRVAMAHGQKLRKSAVERINSLGYKAE